MLVGVLLYSVIQVNRKARKTLEKSISEVIKNIVIPPAEVSVVGQAGEIQVKHETLYNKVRLDHDKKCPLFDSRCKEKGCYAFVDGKCNQFNLDFINYENKDDR